MGKAIWKSKTLWVNLIAIVALFFTDSPLDPTLSAQILAGINMVLRFVTKEPIEWK